MNLFSFRLLRQKGTLTCSGEKKTAPFRFVYTPEYGVYPTVQHCGKYHALGSASWASSTCGALVPLACAHACIHGCIKIVRRQLDIASDGLSLFSRKGASEREREREGSLITYTYMYSKNAHSLLVGTRRCTLRFLPVTSRERFNSGGARWFHRLTHIRELVYSHTAGGTHNRQRAQKNRRRLQLCHPKRPNYVGFSRHQPLLWAANVVPPVYRPGREIGANNPNPTPRRKHNNPTQESNYRPPPRTPQAPTAPHPFFTASHVRFHPLPLSRSADTPRPKLKTVFRCAARAISTIHRHKQHRARA